MPARITSPIDLYATENLIDPYPAYRSLRDLGGAVWLSKYDMFVLSRFDDVREALGNAEGFSSARGVTMNAQFPSHRDRSARLCARAWWAAMIWEAADRGEIDARICPNLMNDYMGPSLDTTIFAIANAIWLFARHPQQWDIVRANPALIPQAINETLLALTHKGP